MRLCSLVTSSSPGASGCFCGSAAYQALPASTASPAHVHAHATPVGGMGQGVPLRQNCPLMALLHIVSSDGSRNGIWMGLGVPV